MFDNCEIISELFQRPKIFISVSDVVSCKIKLFWNNFEIISTFYFTRNNCREIKQEEAQARENL